MELEHSPLTHTWDSYRLAVQILRSWVRDSQGNLPAWTPAGILTAYDQLLASCEAILVAIKAAERDEWLKTPLPALQREHRDG